MTEATPTGLDLDAFADLAWARRTSLQMDLDRPVPLDLVQRLCELATAAPNHKRTWPWRFALFTGDGRAALGEVYACALLEANPEVDPAKVAKARTKYLRAPAVLLAGSVSPEAGRVLEDGYAVAAGLQNLLLGATAAGLASFWSTPPVLDAPGVLDLAGFPAGARVVGVVYLGWPSRAVETPARPPAALTHIAHEPART